MRITFLLLIPSQMSSIYIQCKFPSITFFAYFYFLQKWNMSHFLQKTTFLTFLNLYWADIDVTMHLHSTQYYL